MNLKNFWLLCGIALPVVLYLAWFGIQYLRFNPPETEDPLRLVAGYLPLAVAAVCILGLFYVLLKNANRRIGTSPGHFLYSGPGQQLQIRWEELTFIGPRPDQKPLFPTASVSAGDDEVSFEKFFFPEFEEICRIVEDARKAVKREDLVI